MKAKSYLFVFAVIICVSGLLSVNAIQAKDGAQGIDPYTGIPFEKSSSVESKNPTQPSAPGCIHLLWDVTHGNPFGYDPYNKYSTLRLMLQDLGISVTMTSNLMAANLQENYDILVVNLASSHSSAYTFAEANLIESFVRKAGTLLIMGDNVATPNWHIQQVAQKFGVTMGVSSLAAGNFNFSTFAIHELFQGVAQITYNSGGELNANMPSKEVAWDRLWPWWMRKGTVAVAEYYQGRVVAVSDVNFCDNWRIGLASNRKFTENIFGWLKGTVGSGDRPTWIQVTSPNGGETWLVGRNYTIRWNTDKYVGKVYVEFKRAGGGWFNVAPWDGADNNGSFTYRPNGDDVSEQCWIRVRFRDDASIYDISNNPFRVRWGGLSKGNEPGGVANNVDTGIPTEFQLMQNFPNPFNPTTTIAYQLPAASEVVLGIFDVRGNEVRRLVQGSQSAGHYSVEWDGRDNSGQPVSSGYYFYRITANNHTASKKCLLVK